MEYPIVQSIVNACKAHQLSFIIEENDELWNELMLRRIHVYAGDQMYSINIDDECDDCQHQHPPVMLQLVLDMMESYEEAEDYLVWCKDCGYKAANRKASETWFELREVVPQLRKLLGGDLHPISSWDWQMNTGAPDALRNSKL